MPPSPSSPSSPSPSPGQERHHERFAMLNRSLEQTDAELAKVAQTEKSLEHEVSALETQVQKTLMEAKTVETTIFSTLGEQMAVEKGTENSAKATEKLCHMPAAIDGAIARASSSLVSRAVVVCCCST